MKIAICGSMHFSKEMLERKKELEKMGHRVIISPTTQDCLVNPELNMDLDYCFKNNVQENYFNLVAESEAILVLNYEKNGIKGYVGGATLMEMAIAQHLGKKIFLLNQSPKIQDLRYSIEIQLAKPIILNGDLSKIV